MSTSAARPPNPRRLDVAAWASRGVPLTGTWPLQELLRLREDATDAATKKASSIDGPEGPEPALVHWSARGELRPVRAAPPQVWLHLQAHTKVRRTCQRCLQPVDVPMRIERSFRFVDDEEQAAALDAEAQEEVLALSRSLDLQELVEDELLLDLPLVPRHESCPQPLSAPPEESTVGAAEQDERPHPFAALAALKRERPDH